MGVIDIHIGKRCTLDELYRIYPGMWVILSDCDMDDSININSGIVVAVCNDADVEEWKLRNFQQKLGYRIRRMGEDSVKIGYIHCENYEVGVASE